MPQEPYVAVEVRTVKREPQETKEAKAKGKAKAKALVKCGLVPNQAPVKCRPVLNHTQPEALWNRDSLASSVIPGARDMSKLACLLVPGARDPSMKLARLVESLAKEREAIAKVPGQEY